MPNCVHTSVNTVHYTVQNRAGSRISRGGAWTHFWGGFGLRRGHFSVKMYGKMKELGPVGGVCRHASLDPPMQKVKCILLFKLYKDALCI